MRNARTVLAGALLLGAAVASGAKAWRAELEARPEVMCALHFEGGAQLQGVPQALTLPQMQRGLSGRTEAGPGMLFTWPDDDRRWFWMRNTRMPLSVAFIDAAGVVVQIEHMEPETDLFHLSRVPVREALEVPRGQFEALGITDGSRLLSRSCVRIGTLARI